MIVDINYEWFMS